MCGSRVEKGIKHRLKENRCNIQFYKWICRLNVDAEKGKSWHGERKIVQTATTTVVYQTKNKLLNAACEAENSFPSLFWAHFPLRRTIHRQYVESHISGEQCTYNEFHLPTIIPINRNVFFFLFSPKVTFIGRTI